ncbi:MAG: peptidase, partial [Proteobacteria bacterium]|nr:peptidase [Pseudomonadota bacterium]
MAAIRLWCAALAACTLMAGCGGGGGGGGGGTPQNPTYTVGSYAPPTAYAAHCAVPRSGTDPYTGARYPDVSGSVVWENFWIRSWTHAYYLWYAEVPDLDPASYSTTDTYFQLMKTSGTNPSGTPKDKPDFHFTYATKDWEALSFSGASVGYGITWSIVQPTSTTPPEAF